MAIFNFTNPGQYGSAYFTLETVPNSQGFFDSSSFPNAQGYYSNFTNLNESYIVTSSYVFGVVVPPGSSSFEFNPSNSAMPTGSLYFRGTGGIGITVDTYSGSYVVSPSQGYNGKVLNTFPLTPIPNFQARVAANSGSYEALSCQNTVLADIGTEILSSASLLVTPNGYTEGVLFSTLPNSASGDFTVTRATTATRTNASGLIELVPYNLFEYSEQFENSYWVKDSGVSVNSNVGIAPNGTTTADRLNLSTGGAVYRSGLVLATGSFTLSVWLKGEGTNIGKQVLLEFTNGDSTVTLTGDWQRFTTTGSNVSFAAIKRSTVGQADSVLAWGIQLVEGTNALPYQPTTTRLNISRADYSLGGCPNILLEPQRTNLMLRSEEFDNVVWNRLNTSVSINTTISPSGVQNADSLFENTATGLHLILQAFVSTATTYSYTCYIKPDTRTRAYLRTDTSVGTRRTLFDLTGSGSVVILNHTSATITNVGNGWYKCSITFTEGLGAVGRLVAIEGAVGTDINYTGNGLTAFYLYGAQLEAGAYATSYIPTTSASVTRNADVISRGNIFTNGLITAAGGTWFVELRNNIVRTRDTFSQSIFIGNSSSGVSSNGFGFGSPSSGRITFRKVVGGTSTQLFITTTDSVKLAVKWNGTTADVFVNGVKEVAATAFTSTNMEWLVAQAQDVPKYINSMALAPVPLSDSQCIELTGGGYDTPELAYASLGLTSESPLYLNQSVNSLIF
jgi:hypothetical protein